MPCSEKYIKPYWKCGYQGTYLTHGSLPSITLLYKKGDPSGHSNYRPIVVSRSMYVILARILLLKQ